MALLTFEGFDGLINPIVPPGWVGATGEISTAYGRNGSKGFRVDLWDTNGTNYLPATPPTELIVGMAVAVGGDTGLFGWFGPSGTRHLTIGYSSSLNTWQLGNSASATIASAPNGIVASRAWNYLECSVIIGPAGTGRFIMRQNGAVVIDYNGTTRLSGTDTTVSQFRLLQQPADQSRQLWIDDLYILNNIGTPNTFLGDCQVVTLFPNGNGSSSQGTGSDGNSVDNYALVNEVNMNTATYVDLSIGERDMYTYTDPAVAQGFVHGVQTRAYVTKTDAGGTIGMRNVARLASTEIAGADYYPGAGSFGFTNTFMPTKPGGGAWTLADLSAAEFGAEGVS